MKRAFLSTAAIMVVTLGATLASFGLLGSEVFAKQSAWKKCPLPPLTRQIELSKQYAAWNRAKTLVIKQFPEGAAFIKSWQRPCLAVRMDMVFVGDPDGPEGSLPPGEYIGLHSPAEPFMKRKTGEVLACEYVYIFLPPEAPEHLAHKVLTHEYLHAIFYRLWFLEPGFRATYSPDDSEVWVRVLMDDKEWLRENGIIE